MNDLDAANFLEASIDMGNSAKIERKPPFFCNTCNKHFARKVSLIEHTATVHSDKKPFSCDICAKSFALEKQLRRHTKLHTGERKFSCVECGKSFKDNSYLKRHMDTHNDNPYICGVCGNSFRRKDGLQQHKKLHGHEDPCSDVDQKFDVTFADEILDTHRISHDAEKKLLNIKENVLLCDIGQVQLKKEPGDQSLS